MEKKNIYEVLKSLVEIGNRWRTTAPVDDDFVSLKISFDNELYRATEYLKSYNDARSSHGFVLQHWVTNISYMQQSVLITGVRGCDGLPKYHPAKYVQRWYRRCFMLSAMDGKVLEHPGDPNGGSFTGPVPGCIPGQSWHESMDRAFGDYLKSVDQVPHHFHLHLMHGAEILGYKHPNPYTRDWWHKTYLRMVNDMHLRPESEEEMDSRLGDSREEWLKRNDPCNVE